MAGSGVDLLFGPMLLGVLLSNTAYGIMTVQMLRYYQTYKKDATWIRYFILYLFFMETANVLLEIGIIYEPLILRYGSQQAMIISPLLLPADAITIVLVSTPIQLFTAWRISVITGSVVLAMIISVLAVASFGGGLLVTIFVAIRNEFREFPTFSSSVILWLVCSAVCDVMIAVILAYSLYSRKTGFGAVDGQINRIIRLTVQTGAVTAIAAIADVLLFLLFPATTLQFIPDFPLSKLYTICLLSTLNARTRGKADDPEKRMPNALFKDETTIAPSSMHTSVLPSAPTKMVLQNSVYPSQNWNAVDQASMGTLMPPSGKSGHPTDKRHHVDGADMWSFGTLDSQPAEIRHPAEMRSAAMGSRPKMVVTQDARRPTQDTRRPPPTSRPAQF
ncbi:hypothetical protein B0H17DRAFT_1085116 [Mycena rosella]|uniref:DUF6534 domain-containing protein n=1 Tax=Mycena rosella TaxID=1033263 RepID=A0AAD7D330_MYCRO|nr:hypothetical protein B0H17DRAFT_1085116 [Mycena rosella]